MFRLQKSDTIPVEVIETESGLALVITNPDIPDEYVTLMELNEEGASVFPNVYQVLLDWGYKPEIIDTLSWDADGSLYVNKKDISEDESEDEGEEENIEEENE